MPNSSYTYVIVGAGLAGGKAAEGIREIDKKGSILLVGNENVRPYDRPPLSKHLWTGKKTIEDIFIKSDSFYLENRIDLVLNREIVGIDPVNHLILDNSGNSYRYERLLLATGGIPRVLPVSGSNLAGIHYYRYLDDYKRLRSEASSGKEALIIGGGFIGSELAAALTLNKLSVSMMFPDDYPLSRILPESLGKAIQEDYIGRGIKIFSGDIPVSFEKKNGRFVVNSRNGLTLESDILIVGAGIQPEVSLATLAGLNIENGIVVNEFLQTSNPDIFAAGDNTFFPYKALGKMMRIEHWDNSISQGILAGKNMAGSNEAFTYMPYFFSDLFDFGFEAVGDIDSSLEIVPCWETENEKGILWYLRNNRIVGAMMCNIWNKVDSARKKILAGEKVELRELCAVMS